MHVAYRFVIAALATWRISFLVVHEKGPGDLAAWIRRVTEKVPFFGPLLRCVKCVSLWVAIPFAPFVGGTWQELVVQWLAIAAVAALIDEWNQPPFQWQETKEGEPPRDA